jgi:3-phenylpropionate/trans-cinnamate dioxygenase ferredoxin reductase subunit
MTAVDEPSAATIMSEEQLAAHGIRHLSGVMVTNIDRASHTVLLDDGSDIPYAKLLLATGARPRKLNTPGADVASVLYLRTFADALAMRAYLKPGIRLMVIGGGFIGLEIAASALERGCSVTVVEMAPRILGRAVPAEVAAVVAEAHMAAGIRQIVGIGIAAIERQGSERVPGNGACREGWARDRERHPREWPVADRRPGYLRRR